jgi:hypothetical protein
MEGFKTMFWFSKFQRARERISSKFINNLRTRLQKRSPALAYSITTMTFHTFMLTRTIFGV